MTPFLNELITSIRHDRTFRQRMHEIGQCYEADPDRAWQLLDETPAVLHTNSLYLLRLGRLHHAEEDFARALPIWQELHRRWPADVASFANGFTALQRLGRRKEARELLRQAPRCYHRFRLYWQQLIESSDPEFQRALEPGRLFRGQPDLGGLLLTSFGVPVDPDRKRDFDFVPDPEQPDTL